MKVPVIDLAYLERLYKGDRSRLMQWIHIYLEEAPKQFDQLTERLACGDATGLAAVAHDLRPQAHYVGSPRMLELLVALGESARTQGASACRGRVEELLALGAQVDAELRAVIGQV